MKILLAVPCLDTVPVEFMLSLMQLKLPEKTQLAIERNSLIHNARNNLFFKAVNGGYDWIFFVDSDMVLQPDTLIRLIETAQSGHDYVSALTISRRFPPKPTICKELHWERHDNGEIDHGCEYYEDYPRDSIFPIAASGCACLLVKIEIIEKVIRSYGVPPFDALPCVGEDYSFCWRLGQLGIEMVCDSRVKPGHVGTYIYNEDTYLASRHSEREGDSE